MLALEWEIVPLKGTLLEEFEFVFRCVVLLVMLEVIGADRFLLRSKENCCCSTEKGMVVHAKGRELFGSQATA